MTGAAIIFFAYIGFDQAATTAQEARDPQRTVPIGILAALVIATVLYVVMAAVMTGMVPYGAAQRGGAGRGGARCASRALLAGSPGQDRRDHGDDLGDPDVAPRPAAHLHGDVARRAALAGDGARASEISHPAHRHGDHRCGRGRHRGDFPARRARRADLHRHPARLRGSLRRRAGAALHLARHPTAVPGAGGVAHLHRGRASCVSA